MNPSPGVDLQPEFFGFFATPAFVVTLADADVINATLRDLVLEREGSDTGLDLSNVGGWHSGVDFIDWGGPALHQVLNAARSVAGKSRGDLRSQRREHDREIRSG